MRAGRELAEGLADAPGDLLGPAELFRLRGRHRAQLVVKTEKPREVASRAAKPARRRCPRDARGTTIGSRRRGPANRLTRLGIVAEKEHVQTEELDPQIEATRRLALAQIRQYPDPVLRLAAQEVEEFDDGSRPARRPDDPADAGRAWRRPGGHAGRHSPAGRRLADRRRGGASGARQSHDPRSLGRDRGGRRRLPVAAGRRRAGRAGRQPAHRGARRRRCAGRARARGPARRGSPSTRSTISTASSSSIARRPRARREALAVLRQATQL